MKKLRYFLLILFLIILCLIRLLLNYFHTGRIIDDSLIAIVVLVVDAVINWKMSLEVIDYRSFLKLKLLVVLIGFLLTISFNYYSYTKFNTPIVTVEVILLLAMTLENYYELKK